VTFFGGVKKFTISPRPLVRPGFMPAIRTMNSEFVNFSRQKSGTMMADSYLSGKQREQWDLRPCPKNSTEKGLLQ